MKKDTFSGAKYSQQQFHAFQLMNELRDEVIRKALSAGYTVTVTMDEILITKDTEV